ncbi:hypothetical protein DESPIG_00470 [Desulfovibrio piger ATCC 29098]|uniref:Uncharacterized protein n=1 Tax=Desulfovibrio piger ATCC 29098 TaxID=411464 RepID=B6WQZ0_9BACT|nr:hypothetical protein DESPIG_00470 [Desulfovibrio piger ATCC 29098]
MLYSEIIPPGQRSRWRACPADTNAPAVNKRGRALPTAGTLPLSS